MQMQNQSPSTNGAQTQAPTLGLLEWFEVGEQERVEQALQDLNRLGVDHLRTGFSWADWRDDGGEEWYSWLMPRLADEVTVLPCFTYTPPELGIEPKCSSPPRRPEAYVEFVDRMLTRFGDCFEWVELWNEPNNTNDWDWHLDHNWHIFSKMIKAAAEEVHAHDKKTVFAGMCPPDPNWLDMMGERGVLQKMDAVGIHGFPGTWNFDWTSWDDLVGTVRELADEHGSTPEVWITEAGYSTWQHDEYRQLQEFVMAAEAPVERLYWYSLHDLAPDRSHQEGFHQDERHYHLGLRQHNGREKLLFRIWAEEGLEGIKDLATLKDEESFEKRTFRTDGEHGELSKFSGSTVNGRRPVLITGGAGFIGANLAHRLLSQGEPVRIYDNLSRPGVEENLRWLIEEHGSLLSWEIEDVRNRFILQQALKDVREVFHFAGQVAVTTSMDRPEEDFTINARGTLNLLEALRGLEDPPPVFFTSTNKVYGPLEGLRLREEATRYVPEDEEVRANGISEERPLRFHSPYGCSKGAAEQYVLDYARTYDLQATVFRMSCIYGTHQFGTEDQGWVAHFVRRTIEDAPITLFGTGKQVRDILYVDDLVRAFLQARSQVASLSGGAFNIGGGPSRAVSLLELIDLLDDLAGGRPPIDHQDWRRGDQRYYVTDFRKFSEVTEWSPSIGVQEGVRRLYDWQRRRTPSARENIATLASDTTS